MQQPQSRGLGYRKLPSELVARGSQCPSLLIGASPVNRGRDSILSQVVPLPLSSRIRREVVGHDIGRGPGHRARGGQADGVQ